MSSPSLELESEDPDDPEPERKKGIVSTEGNYKMLAQFRLTAWPVSESVPIYCIFGSKSSSTYKKVACAQSTGHQFSPEMVLKVSKRKKCVSSELSTYKAAEVTTLSDTDTILIPYRYGYSIPIRY